MILRRNVFTKIIRIWKQCGSPHCVNDFSGFAPRMYIVSEDDVKLGQDLGFESLNAADAIDCIRSLLMMNQQQVYEEQNVRTEESSH